MILTTWLPEDIEPFYALHADPVVMKFFISGPYDRALAELLLNEYLAEQEAGRVVKWRLQDRQTGRLIGRAGFGPSDDGQHRELGYLLCREMWGQGRAHETASALVRQHFQTRADLLHAYAHVENLASRRVLEKIGFSLQREGDWRGKPHAFYSLSL